MLTDIGNAHRTMCLSQSSLQMRRDLAMIPCDDRAVKIHKLASVDEKPEEDGDIVVGSSACVVFMLLG